VIVVLATIAATAGPAFASEPSATSVGASLQPGDRVIDNGITVEVPEAGRSIYAAAEYADGTFQELQITTAADGAVRLLGYGDDAHTHLDHDPIGTLSTDASSAALSASAVSRRSGECSAYDRRSYGWRTPVYRWRYSARTTPRKFTSRANGRQQVVDALIRANRSITSAHNRCGRNDRVSARFEYLGVTRRRPLGSGTSCGRADGVNTIGWGYLPNRAIAYMCVLSGNGRSLEADVKISTTQPYETTMSRCSGEFLIEAAMTHEFGHVYGLGHVRRLSLTMAPHVSWCSRAQRTLGMGDMLGLERKY
jgi:hypothetical protein